MSKTSAGRFFEDFQIGETIRHATPRTVTYGDSALYSSLYGMRFALQSSDAFARACGLPRAPVDDLLAFHVVFGKTVPDISLNAVANLGYANCRFLARTYPGDTLSATSDVIGLKHNSDGKTGVVYVRSMGTNQRGETVLDYVRWVMVRKREEGGPLAEPQIPDLPSAVEAENLVLPDGLDFGGYDAALAGSAHFWDDYEPGERIDHVDGMTIEDAEHMMATRLYQNTARVHFNQHTESKGRFGHRIVYGGHIISLARALSFNGFANAPLVLGINGGRHVGPAFAGDTVYAWSEVLDKQPIGNRLDAGALRVRLVAAKDRPCADFPYRDGDGKYDQSVLLDLDCWIAMPRR